MAKKARRAPRLTASNADRHVLYAKAVQDVEHEIDFVDATYKKLRGRRPARLREDFCGTANSACEWVRRRPENTAAGLDLDAPTLAWAHAHTLASLTPDQRDRVTLLRRNVLTPGRAGARMDVVLAMNFSYWVFKARKDLVRYFRAVRASLAPGGLFILDHYGGSDALREMSDRRACGGFTYIWEQERYNPINGDMTCHIHFAFPDGTRLRRAFTYHWRHWTLPELRDALDDAGFSKNTVYWEGEDARGEGNGVFRPRTTGDADPAFITFLVAER